jgi:hypothetical protein
MLTPAVIGRAIYWNNFSGTIGGWIGSMSKLNML